jgi:hypothetical protein
LNYDDLSVYQVAGGEVLDLKIRNNMCAGLPPNIVVFSAGNPSVYLQ